MPKNKRDRNRVTIYIPNELIEEINEMAKDYDVAVSKIIQDCWKIAKNCNCQIPKGVVAYSKERGHIK